MRAMKRMTVRQGQRRLTPCAAVTLSAAETQDFENPSWPGDNSYCAGNSVGAAAFVTGGGFHLPVSASLFGA
jgi:hypothetical protein